MTRIRRDAFLYLDPKPPKDEFAQCSTCRFYLPVKLRCALIGRRTEVPADASCGYYVNGDPDDAQPIGSFVTPEEAGLVRRQVRCENCRFFSEGRCELFSSLNEAFPSTFDLDESVDHEGCCNAQIPGDEGSVGKARSFVEVMRGAT